ncbi:MAG: CPBP family glutamic-type intramembrane protease [Methanomicrobiales archaeon]|nr:CPBP family glutamic-type intramembrane protease [Methanomicrobiales archaeon]
MFEQDVVKKEYISGYILSLLALSWGIPILQASGVLPLISLGIVPFIPGLLALLFLSLEGHPIEVHAWPLLRPVTVPAVVFAVLFPFVLIGLAAFVALGTGLGSLTGGAVTGMQAGVVLAASAFIYAIPASLGQEYGYRGYLLPALTYWQGKVAASLSGGILWGLAMAPASYLILSNQGSGDPLVVALFGSLFTVAVAFAFSWGYYLSENILPVVLMNILLVLAIPAFFPGSWNPVGTVSRGLLGVTWPTPLPLLLLVALAFVPVFAWLFTAMDGEIGGDAL